MKVMNTKGMVMLVAALAGLITGCETTGAKRTDNLQADLDSVSKNLGKASVTVSNTLDTLNSLQLEDTDLSKVYPDFKKQVNEVSSGVERIKKGVAAVQEAGKAKFDAWKAELDAITSEDIKKESMKRMEDSLKEHEDLVTLLKEASTNLDPLVANLTDIVKYLDLDLSKEGVKKLSGGIKDANKCGNQVQEWISDVIKELSPAS